MPLARIRVPQFGSALNAVGCVLAAYLLVLVVGYFFQLFGVRRHHIEAASFVLLAVLLSSVMTRRGSHAEPVATEPGALPVSVLGVFITGSVLLYQPVLWSGLFADDFGILGAARQGRLTVWRELFRPVVFVIWRIVDAVPGPVHPLLHLLNASLHGLNGFLVALLAHRLGLNVASGVIAGGLFVGFPAAVEAVAWASGIQDVLMTTFVLTFIVLVVTPSRNIVSDIASSVALAAACLTKETAVVAPALAGLCLLVTPARGSARRLVVGTAVVLVFLAARFAFVPLPEYYGRRLSRHVIKELLVQPFASLIIPLRSAEARSFPMLVTGFAGSVVVVGYIALAGWARRSRDFTLALACAGFVLVSIAPLYSFFYVSPDLFGSRYLYLGCVGWTILLVVLGRQLPVRSPVIPVGLAAGILASWIVAARMHMDLWIAAADVRDKTISAVGSQPQECSQLALFDLPDSIDGVPLFPNNVPEAMREQLPDRRIRVQPATTEAGECVLRWSVTGLTRER